ncbi:MAG: transketolase family protein [Clostridia bacterium]|nr:transketolase family protein [Clostridia bacterium]
MADIATREAYGKALVELGKKHKFYVLSADLADSVKVDYFKKAFPERYIECGIAEANMMGVAAGIASTGVPAVASSYAMFTAGRAYEQIRNSIAYPNLHVVIGASHSGVSVGEDGATHQCCEDIALMRVIPGMTVISPCDAIEAAQATEAALLEAKGPVYLRLSRPGTPAVNGEDYKFELGKGIVLADGKDVTIVATGLMVAKALKAREILLEKGIDAAVINIHTIKPIDSELLTTYAKKTGNVVTVEEHSTIGGLGSAVAEVLCENAPCKLTRVGVNDKFGVSGPSNDVLAYFGLTAEGIAEKVEKAVK